MSQPNPEIEKQYESVKNYLTKPQGDSIPPEISSIRAWTDIFIHANKQSDAAVLIFILNHNYFLSTEKLRDAECFPLHDLALRTYDTITDKRQTLLQALLHSRYFTLRDQNALNLLPCDLAILCQNFDFIEQAQQIDPSYDYLDYLERTRTGTSLFSSFENKTRFPLMKGDSSINGVNLYETCLLSLLYLVSLQPDSQSATSVDKRFLKLHNSTLNRVTHSNDLLLTALFRLEIIDPQDFDQYKNTFEGPRFNALLREKKTYRGLPLVLSLSPQSPGFCNYLAKQPYYNECVAEVFQSSPDVIFSHFRKINRDTLYHLVLTLNYPPKETDRTEFNHYAKEFYYEAKKAKNLDRFIAFLKKFYGNLEAYRVLLHRFEPEDLCDLLNAYPELYDSELDSELVERLNHAIEQCIGPVLNPRGGITNAAIHAARYAGGNKSLFDYHFVQAYHQTPQYLYSIDEDHSENAKLYMMLFIKFFGEQTLFDQSWCREGIEEWCRDNLEPLPEENAGPQNCGMK